LIEIKEGRYILLKIFNTKNASEKPDFFILFGLNESRIKALIQKLKLAGIKITLYDAKNRIILF
jgi:hypothetical protein